MFEYFEKNICMQTIVIVVSELISSVSLDRFQSMGEIEVWYLKYVLSELSEIELFDQ